MVISQFCKNRSTDGIKPCIRYLDDLFSSLKVWIMEATVKRLRFGCTIFPASLIGIPWARTWSTGVARILLESICPSALALPLPPTHLCPLPLPLPSGFFQNSWNDPWPFYLSILRFWLVCEQFWLFVFPHGELCVNWVQVVMTLVTDIECQCFLN